MRKYHFSRAETRAMSLDHPIGDPTGGVAYNEKNDPVSAIISLATMGGTYAAAGSFAAMTVMQGITFAGAAISLVGNVSGNKTLQKIGMVAGIAGGIGQLAGIQGPTLGETFGKLGSKATTPITGTGGASPTANLNQTPSAGGSVQSSAQGYAGNALNTSPAPAITPPPANVAAGADVLDDAATAAARARTPYGGMGDAGATDLAQVATSSGAGSSAWESVKGAGKAVMDFTAANPGAAVMLGSTAQTLADYLSGKTDAEIDALESQKELYGAKSAEIQEAISRERQRRKNLQEGYMQVNAGFNVNPDVSMQPAGLIAQQMPQA